MTLEETRLDLAVQVAVRALRGSDDATTAERIAAFEQAYATLAGLDTGDEEWTVDTLYAAWELVRDAYAKGGSVDQAVEDVAAAHAAVVATARAPRPDQRSKPRRDG